MQIFPVQKIYDQKRDKWQKVPAIPKGKDWREYQASTDEFNRATNVGIVIPSGVVIIDLDTDKGVSIDDIERVAGVPLEWDSAQLQQTVSGGYHYAFSLPLGVEVKQGSDLLGVVGFDTRCSGKGWICSGDGYTDLTMFGLPDALGDEDWPELPIELCELLAVEPVTNSDDDLAVAVAYEPLEDLDINQMREYLAKLPAQHVDHYDSWLSVGMAISHQTRNSKDGLQLFDEWSQQSTSYDKRELRAKWQSFAKRNTTNPVTFASVIAQAGGRVAISETLSLSLEDKAQQVVDKASYLDFKAEVKAINKGALPDDLRAMLAGIVCKQVGNDLGLNRTEIKKSVNA